MRDRTKDSGRFLASNILFLDWFERDDVDVLCAQAMSNEYLVPFDGMDEDDFMILSSYSSYCNNFLYHLLYVAH